MSKRQTKRERKELARKTRLEAQRRAARRRRVRKLYTGLTVLGIVVAVVAVVYTSGQAQRNRDKKLNALATAAGCNRLDKFVDPTGANHIQQGQTVNYGRNPPTSGDHIGAGTANTGPSEQPIPNELQVHNLEHGHIGMQFTSDVQKGTRDALVGIANAQANQRWVFVAPKPDMGETKLAFTAWGKLVACNDASTLGDTAKVLALANEFVRQYRDKSPRESVPGSPQSAAVPPAGSPSPGGSP